MVKFMIGPLPVELSSFSAVNLENGIKLKWRTETEVSNYGFDIERHYLVLRIKYGKKLDLLKDTETQIHQRIILLLMKILQQGSILIA